MTGGGGYPLDIPAVLRVLAAQVSPAAGAGVGAGEPTRLEALRWYSVLLERVPRCVRAEMVLRRSKESAAAAAAAVGVEQNGKNGEITEKEETERKKDGGGRGTRWWW